MMSGQGQDARSVPSSVLQGNPGQGQGIVNTTASAAPRLSAAGVSATGTGPTTPAGGVRLVPVSMPLPHIAATANRSQTGTQPHHQHQPLLQPQTKQLSYHVPRGPAAVASLSVPRASAAPRAPTATPPLAGWPAVNNQLRPSAVVYTPRLARPYQLQFQMAPGQRSGAPRPATPQTGTTTVVARAVRPTNSPSPRPTPPPQVLHAVTSIRTTTPKVIPLVQRNYPPTKVVALGVRSNIQQITSRTGGGAYFYEVAGNPQQPTAPPSVSTAAPPSATLHSIPLNISSAHTTINTYTNTATNLSEISHQSSNTITIPQRPSILRKRDNEGSPVKTQWANSSSPPGSPGGSTTESAASSPELDNEEPTMHETPIPVPQIALPTFNNNCSPRKKPRKQLLSNEGRGVRGSECEFPSEGAKPNVAPSPPPTVVTLPIAPPIEVEKPPRRAQLGSAWRCAWRANALHFTRPGDVRRREERRPSVVELAAQKQVLQKAEGWKIHHLTAQMDDLIDLEAGVLQQATEALKVLEGGSYDDLHRISELLKGNIQRSKIVCEGVAEARSNILRIFNHKTRVSDILARQADKRCFKKHRNQY